MARQRVQDDYDKMTEDTRQEEERRQTVMVFMEAMLPLFAARELTAESLADALGDVIHAVCADDPVFSNLSPGERRDAIKRYIVQLRNG